MFYRDEDDEAERSYTFFYVRITPKGDLEFWNIGDGCWCKTPGGLPNDVVLRYEDTWCEPYQGMGDE